MKKPIYIFSPEISYKVFYKIWSLYPSGGIAPREMIKGTIIWEMIRDRQIYVGIDEEEKDDPVFFASKLPSQRKVLVMK